MAALSEKPSAEKSEKLDVNGVPRCKSDAEKELRRVQAELEDARRRYDDLYDFAPVGLFTFDENGLILEVNLTGADLLGVERGSLIGERFSRFVAEEDQNTFHLYLKCILQKGKKQTCEFRLVKKGGIPYHAHLESIAVPDAEGNPSRFRAAIIDISKRKQAEELLRENEEKYRQIFLTESDAIMIFDATTLHFVEVNDACLRLYGYNRSEFLGLKVTDISAEPEDTATTIRKTIEGRLTRIPLRYHRKKDGTIFPVEISSSTFSLQNRRMMCGAIRDITEHKRAEGKLRESEEAYRGVVDNIAIGVTLISPNMEILALNNQMKAWFPDIDPTKRPICYRAFNTPPREKICSYCPTALTLQDGKVHETVTETPAGDEIRNYRIISSPLTDSTGKVITAIEMVDDITERKRTEEHIRVLSQQLMQAREIERRRLSSDLHDDLAQDLSSLKIGLDTLFDDQPQIPAEKKQRLSQLSKHVQRSIAFVRNLAYGLHPASLDQLGLVHTVRRYCEDFSARTAKEVDFFSVGMDNLKLDFDTKITVYRLIQEGLNNIERHADATHVTIRLSASFPHLILRIEDDGKGFQLEKRLEAALRERRMGLRIMEQRVAILNGDFEVESRPMEGTRILVKIPCMEESNG
jgi:PAS domain S-box-containing protein